MRQIVEGLSQVAMFVLFNLKEIYRKRLAEEEHLIHHSSLSIWPDGALYSAIL